MLRISDLMAPRALTPGCNLLLPLSTSEEIPVSLRDRRGCREVKWSQHTSWAQLRASLSCGLLIPKGSTEIPPSLGHQNDW